MRDRALAALLGIVAGRDGADFGAEFNGDYGQDFGDDYGLEVSGEFGDEFGFGADFGFGSDYGAEFGAAAATAVARPSPAAAAALWKRRAAAAARTAQRNRLIEPNKGSSIKVERYSFTLAQPIVFGTPITFTNFSGQPDTTIRPQRVTFNVPSPMFEFINDIKVANVSIMVGSGVEDAYNYNSNGVGQSLDMPTLSPANRATITNCTGVSPTDSSRTDISGTHRRPGYYRTY